MLDNLLLLSIIILSEISKEIKFVVNKSFISTNFVQFFIFVIMKYNVRSNTYLFSLKSYIRCKIHFILATKF